MLVILAISAGTLMTILFSLMRNAGKKDEIAELLAEEEKEKEKEDEKPKGEYAGGEDDDSQPWEKEADWWQK